MHRLLRYVLGRRHAKRSSDNCGQRKPRSACASAQSDQGLHCPLTESMDSTESKGPSDTLRMRKII